MFDEFFIRFKHTLLSERATCNNAMVSEQLFCTRFAGDLIKFTCNSVVALALYVLLKPVNKIISLIEAFNKLVHRVICAINLINRLFDLLLT
jgi:hypothetical protein